MSDGASLSVSSDVIANDDILAVLSDALQGGREIRIPVSGRSMGPAFNGVSDIHVVPCDAGKLRPGALAVYQRDGRWVVHRIMRKIHDAAGVGYLTKGDGLSQLDSPAIRLEEIRGIVTGVGLKGGGQVDLLSFCERLKARIIVTRWSLY